MTVTDVAFGSGWPRPSLPRWATPLLALALSVAGLVGLTFLFSGTATYEDIARANGFERLSFHVPGTVANDRQQVVRYDVPARMLLHDQTLRFVLGSAPGTPRDPTTRDPLFSADEQGHLADVRGVFSAVRVTGIVAAAVAVIVLIAGALRGRAVLALLVRDAAVLGAIGVAVTGAVAAVAFEPTFLAFHYVFFPQGNFLFDPATSNLLALYPEAYWYAVTLRIGGAVTAMAGAIALFSWLLARSTIVTRR